MSKELPEEPGKYKFQKAPAEVQLDVTDKQVLELFDQKMRAVKSNVKNLLVDFSSWQTEFIQQKRTIREMNNRLTTMEEQNEDLDLDGFACKEDIKAHEIIKLIKDVQADLLSKTVTQTDLSYIKTQLNGIELGQEHVLQKSLKDTELREKLEMIDHMTSKIKAIQTNNI